MAAWAAVRVSQVFTYQAPSGFAPSGGGADVANGAHGHGGGLPESLPEAAWVVTPGDPGAPGWDAAHVMTVLLSEQ